MALGHCHNPRDNVQTSVDRSVDPDNKTPLTFRVPWETPGFTTLVRNAISWGMSG